MATRYAVDNACSECKRLDALARAERAKTDAELKERMRKWHRESKARARKTDEGKAAHYNSNRRYIEKNRDKINAYYRNRRQTDPVARMAAWSRSVLHKVLKRVNLRKDAVCTKLLGYDGNQLKEHIERQFTRGMCWERFGTDIHIDHIIPVAEFLRQGETNPAVIHALSNLRPMWAKENMTKGDLVLSLL